VGTSVRKRGKNFRVVNQEVRNFSGVDSGAVVGTYLVRFKAGNGKVKTQTRRVRLDNVPADARGTFTAVFNTKGNNLTVLDFTLARA
jgi:hypothetical protein